MRDTGPHAAEAGVLAGARGPEARQRPGRRHAARRRRRRAVVDRDPEGLRAALPRAGRLRRRRCRTRRVERISLLMDGSVSMFGLTCAVDDLQITYLVAERRLLQPGQLGGRPRRARGLGRHGRASRIAGGLLKQTPPPGIEYLGMLLGRFGVYGITIYGGYGEGERQRRRSSSPSSPSAPSTGRSAGRRRSSSPASAAASASTASSSCRPTCRKFGDYPLIQALDIAAKPRQPDGRSCARSAPYFPMERGTFWFAAGLSFNSFALVDGIAVVAVEVGDGLDINLLGLARMALPRPQVALVSIELALLVRFSSSRGRAVGAGPAHRQLVAALPATSGSPAASPSSSGSRASTPASSCSRWAATTPTSTATATRVVPRLGLRWSIGERHRHQGRQLLRADLRGADGRRRLRGLGAASARPGPR